MKKRYIFGGLLVFFLLLCVFYYQDPYAIDKTKILAPPSMDNLLGVDNLGRDIFSRMVLGSGITLSIAFLSSTLAVITGIFIGGVAGYYGGVIDGVIVSIIEVIISIPGILIALGIMIALGTGFFSLIVAIFVIYIPRCVNVIRGIVKKEKNMEYIIVNRTYGVKSLRLIYKHILPNIIKPILVTFTTCFAGAILTEASLGYLGLGISPPYPTWGNILNQSQSYFLSAPWFALAPGVAITVTVYIIKKLEKRGRVS